MAEREVIVDKARLVYEGLFDVNELYKLLDKYLRDKGYDKLCTKSQNALHKKYLKKIGFHEEMMNDEMHLVKQIN